MNFLLYSEINVLCITLLGIMAYRASRFGIDTNEKKKAFLVSIHFAILLNIFDLLWDLGLTGAIKMSTWVKYGINAAYFVSLSLSAFFWLVFSEIVQNRKIGKKVLFLIFVLPIALLLTLLLTTSKTGWLYRFDENGKYVRGTLFYLQFVPALIYILIASIKSLIGMLEPNNYERHENFSTMFSYSFATFICALVQFFFQDLPILSTAPTISLLIVYTNSLKIQLSRDSLTGIYNRRKLVDTLYEKAGNPKKNKKLYFIFMDVDNFKTLNDEFGHDEGDVALQLVADALYDVCSRKNGTCGRYGGDEFAVVQELDESENISDLCDEIKREITKRTKSKEAEFPVEVSIGYGEYLKDAQSVPALIRFADKHMYENKKRNAG